MDSTASCEKLAARQHGLISRNQAFAAGLTRRTIDSRVASGRWGPVYRCVYRALPLPDSWHQRLMAAVLYGGPAALASHRSAAMLWGLDGFAGSPLEISVKAGRTIKGVKVHRRREDDDPDAVLREGIPTTSIERTLADLAAVLPLARAGRALDDTLQQKLTTLSSLRAAMPPTGRKGRAVFRRLLNDRDDGEGALESRLETKLLRLLRRGRLPLPVSQYEIVQDGVPLARLDFAYPAHRLGLEADGYRWHGGASRWQDDLRRENRLKLLGWTLLHFSWSDVSDHPELVVAQIRAALERFGQGSLH